MEFFFLFSFSPRSFLVFRQRHRGTVGCNPLVGYKYSQYPSNDRRVFADGSLVFSVYSSFTLLMLTASYRRYQLTNPINKHRTLDESVRDEDENQSVVYTVFVPQLPSRTLRLVHPPPPPLHIHLRHIRPLLLRLIVVIIVTFHEQLCRLPTVLNNEVESVSFARIQSSSIVRRKIFPANLSSHKFAAHH